MGFPHIPAVHCAWTSILMICNAQRQVWCGMGFVIGLDLFGERYTQILEMDWSRGINVWCTRLVTYNSVGAVCCCRISARPSRRKPLCKDIGNHRLYLGTEPIRIISAPSSPALNTAANSSCRL